MTAEEREKWHAIQGCPVTDAEHNFVKEMVRRGLARSNNDKLFPFVLTGKGADEYFRSE